MDGGRFVKQNRMTKDTEKKKILLIANDTTYVYNLRNEVIERLKREREAKKAQIEDLYNKIK